MLDMRDATLTARREIWVGNGARERVGLLLGGTSSDGGVKRRAVGVISHPRCARERHAVSPARASATQNNPFIHLGGEIGISTS